MTPKKRIAYQESGHCEFPAELERISEVAALTKSFCQRNCLDETLWPQIELAICEGLNNAVEHGCQEDPELTVRVSWTWTERRLIVEVEDPGRSFQPTASTQLPEDPTASSGRGQFIMQSIAESCEVERTAYGQKLTLAFATHDAADILEKTEQMYALSQNLAADLNLAYAERDLVAGFAHDLATKPAIEIFIDESVKRLTALVDLQQVNVWSLARDGSLENVFHFSQEGSQLEIREAVIAPDLPCACNTVLASERELIVEYCAHLEKVDPLYEKSGCAIAIPILYQRECLGVMALHAIDEHKERIVEHVLPMALTLGQFIGLAHASAKTFRQLDEHKKAEAQLEVAAEIQQSLLPSRFPENELCRTSGRCEAAMAVGGDYIDIIEVRDIGLLLVIADVMGKGVPAALLGTIFRTAIRSRLSLAETPGWMLSKINEQFCEELGHLNIFITAQVAFLDYDKKVLKLASAGHCPLLLHEPENCETKQLNAEGMPLGINTVDLYEEVLAKLGSRSKLLFITDGLYEAENPRGEMLGLENFIASQARIWEGGIEEVPERAFRLVREFAEGRAPSDDRTLIALEIL